MEILTDEEINKAWGNADFGKDSMKRDIIYKNLCNRAEGYHTGSTITAILKELGLIKLTSSKVYHLTSKGILFIQDLPPKIDFDKAIKQLGFVIDEGDNLCYNNKDEHWQYQLCFEGYAYVLYKNFREIHVPLAEFRDPEKLKTFYNILTEYHED